MQFFNSPGSTVGGLRISRDVIALGRRALLIGSGTTDAFWITSNGSIGINTNSAAGINNAEINNQGIINSNVAGSNGLYFVTAGTNRGFVFEHLGTGSNNTTQAVFQIRKTFTDAGPASYTERLLNFNGTYDLTNNTKNLIGIDYDMAITALSGAHYGMLIRPITRNGIGLGSTLPTAQLHIAAGTATANTAPIKLNTGTALTTPEDGAFEYHASHLYFTIGSTRYQLDQQGGGGGGTVTDVSVVTANGFAGTIATSTTTPAITISTTVTGLLIGNGTSISAAVSGTDYQAPSANLTSLSGLSYASTSFVKMTAAGTFALDTNAYYLASNPSGYTSNTGTVTSVSITTANGISGTVATSTTTPAITLTLGAITPTSVNSVVISGSSTPTLAVTGTSSISGSNTGDNAVNSLYSGLVSNATHTGDATGSTTLTVVRLRGVSLPALGVSAGLLRYTGTGTNTWIFDTSVYLTANQTITLSGAVTGSGTTSISTTLSNSVVGIANLSATGTPSATSFLRGDNTWATITASGGYTVSTQTANFSVTATSGTEIVLGNTSGGSFTITLPTAVGNTATIVIKKTAGTAGLVIDGAGTETIDGGLTASLIKINESVTLISNNANWQII
jgi:hypothetical protein